MIRSMTGYGRGRADAEGRSYNIEIKSVNNRYLDINIRLPRQINPLEERIRKHISSKVNRGKIDVYINQEKFGDEDLVVKVDTNVADAYYNALTTLKEHFGLAEDIRLSHITSYPDIISTEKRDEDIEIIWNVLIKALDEALLMFLEMRSQEGTKLCEDIRERCQFIFSRIEEVEGRSSIVVDEYREKIKARIGEYLKEVEIDEARLLNEVAFFADRCSITEEIVRLKSHISQLTKTLTDKETVGRKLDFLIQEMNREINTIGSKANDLYITNIVVDVKSELEKIREQIQNIE